MISFELKEYGKKLLNQYENVLNQARVPYELHLLEGVPKHELLATFKQLDENDLVICGAGIHHSSLERLLVGSVSDNIVRQSNCDVLVIRTPHKASL